MTLGVCEGGTCVLLLPGNLSEETLGAILILRRSKREKQALAEEVGNIISTLDVLNSRSDALTLLQCAIDQELNK